MADRATSNIPEITTADFSSNSAVNVHHTNVHPPSPTLSTQSSVHFATSLSFRGNERSGYSSLHPLTLSTNKASSHHCNATFTSSLGGYNSVDNTVPSHGSGGYGMVALQPTRPDPTSTVVSKTCMHVDTASDRSRSHGQGPKSDPGFSDETVAAGGSPPSINGVAGNSDGQKLDQENGGISKVEPIQNELVDPRPFKFRPFELASLLDPKNLEALEALGGVEGLLEGLGTHRTRGLTIDGRGLSDRRPGAGAGASQRRDQLNEHPLSTISVTAPYDVPENGIVFENSDPHLASLGERRRVFGENVPPQRAVKSLLALMWLALKDKVLVRIFF
jgi:Ca2+-transporting ATPase